MLYSVIMAGGSGRRFWPLSRKARPKQAIAWAGGESLFQRALARAQAITGLERTFVITNAEQAALLASQATALPAENIVAEPVGRDSAAAVFLAASIIAARDEDAVMLVKPADHIISPLERFAAAVERAVAVAEKGLLVTFGVVPTRPATGYGYIEKDCPVEGVEGAWRVARFKEKPDAATAKEYVESGRYYWNAGIFVWRARDILAAAKEFAPEHYDEISPLGALFGGADFDKALERAYGPLPRISIDYAVMEKAPNVATVEADFQWDDVGSLVSLKGYLDSDESGNIREGLAEVHGSTDCILVSDDDHLVAVVGCDNVVVIHTDDATLVASVERVADLKALLDKLEARGDTRRHL